MEKNLFNRQNLDWVKENILDCLNDPTLWIKDQYNTTDRKEQGDQSEKWWDQIQDRLLNRHLWVKNWKNTYSYLNGVGADFLEITDDKKITIQDVKSTTSISGHNELYFQRLKYHSSDNGQTWEFYSNGIIDDKYLAEEVIYFDTDKKWVLVLDVDKIRDFYFNFVAPNPYIWDHNPNGHIEPSNDGGLTKVFGFFVKTWMAHHNLGIIKKLYRYELDDDDNILAVTDESFRLNQDELFGNITINF